MPESPANSHRDRRWVQLELQRLLEQVDSADEFVHGLSGFAAQLGLQDAGHPVLLALAAELGRASTAAFAASAMHDLRSILQGVSLSLEFIPDSFELTTPQARERAREAIQDALSGVSLSGDLAADALLVYREGGGETCELHRAIPAAVRLCRQLFRHGPAVEIGEMVDAEVRAPYSDLFRVLSNLLRNASEAMEGLCPDATQRVVVSSRSDGEFAYVRVQDTGRGLAPHLQRRIFDLFFSTKAEGSGIGLFVCRALVEAWGGTISIESMEGSGTVVDFSVPLWIEPITLG